MYVFIFLYILPVGGHTACVWSGSIFCFKEFGFPLSALCMCLQDCFFIAACPCYLYSRGLLFRPHCLSCSLLQDRAFPLLLTFLLPLFLSFHFSSTPSGSTFSPTPPLHSKSESIALRSGRWRRNRLLPLTDCPFSVSQAGGHEVLRLFSCQLNVYLMLYLQKCNKATLHTLFFSDLTIDPSNILSFTLVFRLFI